ncbi:MAG TPA: Rieske (2Fe-2S) protein [Candidatus Binatia bacterium]|nr:Rieske (2Fe-2S) protein [Candidatus Binatia bacterium]
MSEPRVPSCDAEPSAAAAVYDRVIGASVERIWENVLDWEHLPYLHSQAFGDVRPLSTTSDGWRALIDLPGARGTTEVEVTLERDRLRYVTATVGGIGEGSRIITSLLAQGPSSTAIHVEFILPWAPAEAAEKIGEAYRSLYHVLWDQDEEMMVRRQRLLDGGEPRVSETPVVLGQLEDVRRRLPFEVQTAGARVRIFEDDGQIRAADLLCPHLGGILKSAASAGCELVCPWHGYRFDARTGRSCDGRSLRLRPAPSVAVDGGRNVVLIMRGVAP